MERAEAAAGVDLPAVWCRFVWVNWAGCRNHASIGCKWVL